MGAVRNSETIDDVDVSISGRENNTGHDTLAAPCSLKYN